MTKIKIKVGMASCGRAAGADKIYQKIESYIKLPRVKFPAHKSTKTYKKEKIYFVKISLHPWLIAKYTGK